MSEGADTVGGTLRACLASSASCSLAIYSRSMSKAGGGYSIAGYFEGSGSDARGGGMADRDMTKFTRESAKVVLAGCS